MKVIIFTEGGSNIGYGHLSRCISLYDEIQRRDIEVEIIIHGDIDEIGFLKGKSYTKQKWINIGYLDKTLSNNNYVIVDSYLAEKKHYEKISLKSNKALYIDDTGRIEYPNGIIVNPALDSQDIDYSYMHTGKVLTGSKYVILRSAFCRLCKGALHDSLRKVLIIMGGTDVRHLTSVILEKICDQNQEIEFEVVLDPVLFDKHSSTNKMKNVRYHKNLTDNEMSQIMLNSDFAISAAGQTINELIAIQTPFIAIQVTENQKNNINSLIKNISPKVVLRYDDNSFLTKLQEMFDEMKSIDNRKIITEKMKDIIDGNGSKRIIDALLKKSESNEEILFRKANEHDVKNVFDLSNKDYVRKYSIHKEKILWEDHVKWFFDVLHDNNIVFYVLNDKNNLFLGQIRYQIEKNNATVSISFLDRIKGRGLAKSVLNESIDYLFLEKGNVNEIYAYISEYNLPSINLFKSLNFMVISSYENIIKVMLRRNEYYGY